MSWFSRHQTRLYSWLTGVLIFLVPSNWFLKFGENTAYVNGIFVDYLLPKLYATDFIILSLLALWLIEVLQKRPSLKPFKLRLGWVVIMGLVMVLVGYQAFVTKPLASWWQLAKLIEMTLLAVFFIKHSSVFRSPVIKWALIVGLLFQSAVGVYQFQFQRAVAGYNLFGEPSLASPIGLARIQVSGAELVLPYGTTAHPNVWAGWLVMGWLLLVSWVSQAQQKTKLWLFGFVSLVVGYGLWLSQSWSAWIAVVVGLLMILSYRKYPIVFSSLGLFVIMPFALSSVLSLATLTKRYDLVLNESWFRREFLNRAAWDLWLKHPWLGVGLNNFTTQLDSVMRRAEAVRFIQPVHHLGLLWLAETGMLGGSLLVIIAFKLRRILSSKSWQSLLIKLAILAPIAALDHYLLSLQTGLLLSVFWLSWPFQLPNQFKNLRVKLT